MPSLILIFPLLLFVTLLFSVQHAYAQDVTFSHDPSQCDSLSVCYTTLLTMSINSIQFDEQINFIVEITKLFASKSRSSLFSAVAFSNFEIPTVLSNIISDVVLFQSLLRTYVREYGSTLSGYGLTQCAKVLGDAPAPRLIVLITDGADDVFPVNGSGLHVAPRLYDEK